MSSTPPKTASAQSAVAAVESQGDNPAGNSHDTSGPGQITEEPNESQTQPEVDESTFASFKHTLVHDILLASLGRSGFQIILLLLLGITYLGLFIATISVKSAGPRLLLTYDLFGWPSLSSCSDMLRTVITTW